MSNQFNIGNITLYHGDSKDVLPTINEKVHSIITDPPYELGFMGKSWDKSGIAFSVDFWKKAYDKLEPGGYLIAFGGTRTYHRMAVAIEDAGFEIRDSIHWTYGSGFPKSLNVFKAIDAHFGLEREVVGTTKTNTKMQGGNFSGDKDDMKNGIIELTASASEEAKQWEGWGTALKPSHEPILVARKPLAEKTVAMNVLKYGTGAINIDAGRIGTEKRIYNGSGAQKSKLENHSKGDTGIGLMDGSGKELEFSAEGRWPSNTIHDGSEAVLACFPQTKSGMMKSGTPRLMSDNPNVNTYGHYKPDQVLNDTYGDEGSAARFFQACPFDEEDFANLVYFAKASSSERTSINNHPTVKPKALMRYLVKLFTPPNGTVLDCFAGSGTTLVGCALEGFRGIGIELGQENRNIEIIKHRVKRAYNKEIERQLTLFV